MHQVGRLLEGLRIETVPCSDAVAQSHLDAFLAGFLEQTAAQRVARVVNRDGWNGAITNKVLRHLDRSKCAAFEGGLDDAGCKSWVEPARAGVCVTSFTVGYMLTPRDAMRLVEHVGVDMILSYEPGRLALLMEHWGGVWCCGSWGEDR